QDVAIVNMSFGLRQNRAVLRQACATAIAAGLILVAAAPARGQAVYPSAYPGVLRVTGDARCALQEFSHLASEQADFGACPRSYAQPEHGAPVGGASFAVPHVSAALARYLAAGGKASDYYQHLTELAVYHGPERRR
ncbi:MAG: peptidase S8 and S53 subtilisin kexin sedolisin, partial [Candidatus Competibacteraceae bacterium]|nr:peptidase S8 and S53 subtilisin kexin sedolisin [Candidatus Competibacteraceae bacterium]